eukprot:2527484-Ditylum_brightwellii.AAC.1
MLYLSAPQACIHVGGHFYLSSIPVDPKKEPATLPQPNGLVHTAYEVLWNVMLSTAKAEIGALYVNTCKGEELRLSLIHISEPTRP